MNNLLPLATVITALGGYPNPPESWKRAATNIIVQIIVVALLVLQSGNANPVACVLISIIFVHIIHWIRHIEIKKNFEEAKKIQDNEAAMPVVCPSIFDPSINNSMVAPEPAPEVIPITLDDVEKADDSTYFTTVYIPMDKTEPVAEPKPTESTIVLV